MAYLALSPVSDAVFIALNVSGLTALLPSTGNPLSDDIAQATQFPFVFFEVNELDDKRGFGTGGLPEVQLRVHVYGTSAQGLTALQAITQKVIQLLRDVSLTVTGYSTCAGVFYDETLTFGDELINGVKVHEIVSQFRIYVQEAA